MLYPAVRRCGERHCIPVPTSPLTREHSLPQTFILQSSASLRGNPYLSREKKTAKDQLYVQWGRKGEKGWQCETPIIRKTDSLLPLPRYTYAARLTPVLTSNHRRRTQIHSFTSAP